MAKLDIAQHAASLSQDLYLAVRAAKAAGAVVLDGAQQLAGEKRPASAQECETQVVEQKGVGDLVSQVDRDADKVACDLLRKESPLPILSEELNCSLEERDNLWIVDPLDASSAFLVQAGPIYPAVLIAQRIGGETTLGVVYFPLTDQWFYALKGRGAWADGKRLICDHHVPLGEAWVEMNQYGDHSFETEYFAELRQRLRSARGARLLTIGVPNSGVAMRIAKGDTALAAAVHDNNPANVKQAPWDIAAPQVILEEAGGVFLNPRGERTDPFVAEPIIVAGSRVLADSLIALATQENSVR